MYFEKIVCENLEIVQIFVYLFIWFVLVFEVSRFTINPLWSQTLFLPNLENWITGVYPTPGWDWITGVHPTPGQD